ncbi:MAG TPA: M6 family metalloprotease domain-containing protein, partial [Polyangiales bacterium]
MTKIVGHEVAVEELRLLKFLAQTRASDASRSGERCMVAPHPQLRDKIKQSFNALRSAAPEELRSLLVAGERKRFGFNDGAILPPSEFLLGAAPSAVRSSGLDRAPLRGVVRVAVVLVDFADKAMTATQAHFEQLFFSLGSLPTKSVREYYREVTNGLIDIQGVVVGPLRMPRSLADYAHGDSGTGDVAPNARTMARDAALAADPLINFGPYDNDGNGFVDAFVIVHAGKGGEETGKSGDIWSHKWVLDGSALTTDGTKIYAYLTVPEDARLGVCAHELGHLLFGFPDLYDTDYSSEGIGDWCLMAGGSWGRRAGESAGDTPCHPSAWCKSVQGWVSVDARTSNGPISLPDIKSSFATTRLWKDGAPSSEYFLLENRQQTGFDASLPAGGLLIWHIDDSVDSNTNESHYKVALMQADGRRDLEGGHNRGDAGDPYPGSTGNASFNASSTPNSKSYAGTATCVSVTGISAAAATMTANVTVTCKAKEKEVAKDLKDARKERKELAKERKELAKEKETRKEVFKEKERRKEVKEPKEVVEKPISDKASGLEKPFDGKLAEHRTGMPSIQQRLEAIEVALAQLGLVAEPAHSPEPFISAELRPDLSQSALR